MAAHRDCGGPDKIVADAALCLRGPHRVPSHLWPTGPCGPLLRMLRLPLLQPYSFISPAALLLGMLLLMRPPPPRSSATLTRLRLGALLGGAPLLCGMRLCVSLGSGLLLGRRALLRIYRTRYWVLLFFEDAFERLRAQLAD